MRAMHPRDPRKRSTNVGRSKVVARASLFVLSACSLLVACGCEKNDKRVELASQAAEAGGADVEDDLGRDGSGATTTSAPPTCEEAPGVTFFVGPETPWSGAPLRVLAISDKPMAGEITLTRDAQSTSAASNERHGGPPYFWLAEIAQPSTGNWTASFRQSACEPSHGEASQTIAVGASPVPSARVPRHGVWNGRKEWTHVSENEYTAWVEMLFDAQDDEEPSWNALHEIIRDPKRNFLFDHLASHEDSGPRAPTMHPDCADLPYFLRAYFAFKMGLPFGLSKCDRGGNGAPPSCEGLVTNEDDDERAESHRDEGAVAMFGAFLGGTVADLAHSGSARAPFAEEDADYYPVAIDWNDLRPGTVYADPYGHTLLVAKRVAQTDGHGGVLFAVDGQPDGTVARKRFWRGNFLYAVDPALGGPGFKRFRPLGRKYKWGPLVRLGDDAIASSAEYGDVSREAEKLDVEAFYDRMEDVLSPKPLDAKRALMETLAALEEQVRTRVKSVDNGRKWLEKHEPPAPMPEGAEIFETNGPWEDYSTPSRDLRLLIAIDVVQGFPERAVRRKERYASPPVAEDLRALLDRELAARSVSYTRSDGSSFTLTLAEVVARSVALERAFNPNDCVEIRWGAPPESEEMSTCKAHAPAEQRTRMETYRAWFHERRRPPRK